MVGSMGCAPQSTGQNGLSASACVVPIWACGSASAGRDVPSRRDPKAGEGHNNLKGNSTLEDTPISSPSRVSCDITAVTANVGAALQVDYNYDPQYAPAN